MKVHYSYDPTEEAGRILNSTFLYVDLDELTRIEYYAQRNLNINWKVYKEYFKEGPTKKDHLIQRFLEMGLPKYKLIANDRLSVSAEILNAIKEDESVPTEIRTAADVLLERRHFLAYQTNLGQYLELPIAKGKSFEGHNMVIAKPYYDLLKTRRYSASNPSLQNVIRDCQSIYTAPEGYIPAVSDSSQIEPKIIDNWKLKDPRLNHLSELYEDRYYGTYHYLMYPESMDNEKQPIPKEERAKLKTLTNASNYGGNSHATTKLEIEYNNRIKNHPNRLKWVQEVRTLVESGVRELPDYFGNMINLENEDNKYTKFKYSSDEREQRSYIEHLVRCGVNNPIQGTAATLMNISVCEAYKLLIMTGIGMINYYKHDEGMFLIKEDYLETMKPRVQNLLSYEVEGWSPIRSDLVVGRKPSFDVSRIDSKY